MIVVKVKVIATKVQAKDLKPGDLFSTAGPLYWENVDNLRSIGERVYIRTNTPTKEATDDPDDCVFRITIETYFDDQEIAHAKQLCRDAGHTMSNAPCSWCGDIEGCHYPAKFRDKPQETVDLIQKVKAGKPEWFATSDVSNG